MKDDMIVLYVQERCSECQRVKDVLAKRGEIIFLRDGRDLVDGPTQRTVDLIDVAADVQFHEQNQTLPVVIRVQAEEMK
jgi:glutaredoxin